ncbi:MAG: peptidylprolyl isomerase [Alphaproteobacteria bacterium]|nr:peptidylprolyl isomerase [Alphaproteobacteria bacterium]
MKTKRIAAALLGACLALPAWAVDPAGVVVARINGTELLLGDVEEARSLLPAELQNAPLGAVYPLLLDSLVNSRLTSDEAMRQGLHEGGEYRRRMARVADQILERMLLARHIEAQVTDAKVRERYDDLVTRMKKESEVRTRHILVEDEAQAKALVKKLDGGEDFAQLARDNSLDASRADGGELGWVGPFTRFRDYYKAASALKPGKHSAQPVQTDFGWHVIEALEVRPVTMPAFEALKPTLVGELSAELGQDLVKSLRDKAEVEKMSYEELVMTLKK